MKVTILGSGTSGGIPEIGCDCPVCLSRNPKNKRTRASILVETSSTAVLVDTGTDFRIQALAHGISRIDAVLFTHAHADHCHGLDDIRPLTREKPIPIYGNRPTIEELTERFSYIFRETMQKGGGKPRIIPKIMPEKPLSIGELEIRPVPIKHGRLDILGYRFGAFAYLTDCSFIPPPSFEMLRGLDTLVLGALRYSQHATHFSIDQAIAAAEKIGARQTWFTHFCHAVEHSEMEHSFPDSIEPSYDGLVFEIDNSF
ncbi:MAG: MBL fold metallo-hydrolase [Spirochaetales bacterium]|nr:MBL fold metallo-hydrolase [Spirochaetales bacterium]MCF7938398.1 MBL fold metallo-hydrolase [Spirochaetales bacterium]